MTYTLPSAPPTTHWGPPLTTSKSITLPHSSTPTLAPFVPYSPQAPLGRIADWNHDPTTTTQDSYNDNNENNNHNNRRHNNNNNTGAQNNRNRHLETYNAYGMMQNGTGIGYTHENEDRSFEVVDNRTNVQKRGLLGMSTRGKSTRGARGGARGGANAGRDNTSRTNNYTKLGGARGNQRGGNRGGRYDRMPVRQREFSIVIQPAWTLIDEIDFVRLNKLALTEPESATIASYGAARMYDRATDRVTTQKEIKIVPARQTWHSVTTSDDPIIQKMASENTGNIFGTDVLFSLLMNTIRSTYSWDVVVTKADGKLFFDHRPTADIEPFSVNENANEAPADGEVDDINSVNQLANESMVINRAITQQFVTENIGFRGEQRSPFRVQGPDLSICYRYRSFKLDAENTMIVRTEFDAITAVGEQQSSTIIRALNEFDSKAFDWKNKLDMARGAVLATEIKNNALKLARWTSQALLGDVEQMKLGFVARTAPRSVHSHVLVGMSTFNIADFGEQISLNVHNNWGILKSLIDLCMRHEDGKYIFIKDPMKTSLRFYRVVGEVEPVEKEEVVVEENNNDDE